LRLALASTWSPSRAGGIAAAGPAGGGLGLGKGVAGVEGGLGMGEGVAGVDGLGRGCVDFGGADWARASEKLIPVCCWLAEIEGRLAAGGVPDMESTSTRMALPCDRGACDAPKVEERDERFKCGMATAISAT